VNARCTQAQVEQEASVPDTGPGRHANGTFAKGNRFGPGNLHARHCARMLAIFRDSVSDEEMYRLFRMLYEKAEAGDVGAAKLILSYKVGKPLSAPNPDSIDRDEWEHYQQDAVDSDAMKQVLGSLPTRVGNDIARVSLPIMSSACVQNLAAQIQPASPTAKRAAEAQSYSPEPGDDGRSADTSEPISNGESASTTGAEEPSSAGRRRPAGKPAKGSARKGGSKEAGVKTSDQSTRRGSASAEAQPIRNGESDGAKVKKGGPKSAKALWLQPLAKRLRRGASATRAKARAG
jgi:hypothetical protein